MLKNNLIKIERKMRRPVLGLVGVFLLFATLRWGILEKPVLYEKYNFSSAVYDRHEQLLKLSLSLDDKYRLFIPYQELPKELINSLVLYEDRGFYHHFGVNPLSLLRAIIDMVKGERKQGASTITMQLARIVYQIDSSTISGKIAQIFRAMQIEMFYSKQQILEAYFNLAPYGGNIEGIGAATQIYFNKKVKNLNLPQILALTVIPQNPSKRQLLSQQGRLYNRKATQNLAKIWKQEYTHSQNKYLEFPLESGIYLPNEAPHFTRLLMAQKRGIIHSTLNLDYQKMVENILRNYIEQNNSKGVYNATAMVVDAQSMNVLAYVGSADFNNVQILGQVDGLQALRSPGSTLKPFIYALALDKGLIHPLTKLKDVPKNYRSYTPENFDHSFYGMLSATEALIYSRNIPAVDLLQQIKGEMFYQLLQQCRVKQLKSVDYYGLSAALGGIEVTAQNLAEMFAMLHNKGRFFPVRFYKEQDSEQKQLISPEAAFMVEDMLTKNPPVDGDYFPYPVAWKTGTSYGYKDAWTAGNVGRYVIVVWVGNFDSTPNNAFVGRDIAAPLFFQIVRKIASQNQIPNKLTPDVSLNLAKVEVCKETGDIATSYCERKEKTYFIPMVTTVKTSDITRLIPINKATGKRACRHRPPYTEMKAYNFWPTDVLQTYARAGISIRRPPEFERDCTLLDSEYMRKAPQILSPQQDTILWVHQQLEKRENMTLKAVGDADVSTIYWFVNDKLVGQSQNGEILTIKAPLGNLNIKAIDDKGQAQTIQTEVRPLM